MRPIPSLVLGLALLIPAALPAPAAGGHPAAAITRIELLGETAVPSRVPGLEGAEALTSPPVGGLSGLAYDPERDLYLAVSDSTLGPARFYTLAVDLSDGRLDDGDVRVIAVAPILDPEGRLYAEAPADPEGIALAPDSVLTGSRGAGGALFVSAEGHRAGGVDPFVRLYSPHGALLAELPVPEYYLPSTQGGVGVRPNRGFESLSISPDGRYLFAGVESALVQDGPAPDLGWGSRARLLRWDLAADAAGAGGEGGRSVAGPPAEWVYAVEPVALPTADRGADRVAGLVELLALGPESLLALERSWTQGVGMVIRLYGVSLDGATPVTGRRELPPVGPGTGAPGAGEPRPATKTLLLELSSARQDGDRAAPAPVPDNLEGLAFGPPLPDGRRTLLVVADDNFAGHQRSQLLAFALSEGPVTPSAVQGRGHRSPLEGSWVRGVEGVVTAVDAGSDPPRLWIEREEGDGDPATSDAVAVLLASGERPPLVADRVTVDARVVERSFPGGLPVTTLAEARLRVLQPAVDLPPPAVLGAGPGSAATGRGRVLPRERIDDDGLTEYQPAEDAIDLWESLEGMRVTVPEPLVVGPTTRYGGFVVVPDAGAGAELRTCAGGLALGPDDPNPERIALDAVALGAQPGPGWGLAVGDRLAAPLEGVVDYAFGLYQVLLTAPVPSAVPGGARTPRSAPPASAETLSVATYNLLNLHPGSSPERFARLAEGIVNGLGAPDLLALQEIQDASGPRDDGTVAGGPTLERLIEAIEAAGGPAYLHRQLDPADGSTGGQPGGNIRVGFLVRPDRLEITGEPEQIAADHPCFAGEGTRYEPGRRPLALPLRFRGRDLVAVSNHWKSKSGDDRLFGPVQPPVPRTEEQRLCQARLVADWVRERLAADPDAWVIVAGDLNEHEFRRPIALLEEAGLVNLVDLVPRADRYTFNYRGNSQVLDHVLVSAGVLRETVAVPEIPHLNSDLPASLAASDHDPVVVRLVPRPAAP